MKFGHLIKYKMRNIFLKKSYRKHVGEASPRPFLLKSKLSISLNQQCNFIKFFFIVCPSLGLPKYIKTNMLTT